jgi:Uma2 family endonuclease
MSVAARLASFDELYARIAALPEGEAGEILEPGVLRMMSRPGRTHRRVARRLARLLDGVDVDNDGGWWLDDEVEIRLGDRLFVPDLAGWRVTDDLAFTAENPILRPPDWVAEILSRSTQRGDRIRKLPTYAQSGVSHVWIVDVEARVLEVYGQRDGVPLLVGGLRPGERGPLVPFDLPVDIDALLATP